MDAEVTYDPEISIVLVRVTKPPNGTALRANEPHYIIVMVVLALGRKISCQERGRRHVYVNEHDKIVFDGAKSGCLCFTRPTAAFELAWKKSFGAI